MVRLAVLSCRLPVSTGFGHPTGRRGQLTRMPTRRHQMSRPCARRGPTNPSTGELSTHRAATAGRQSVRRQESRRWPGDREQQRGRSPPERLVRQPPAYRVSRHSLGPQLQHHRSNSPGSTRHASTAAIRLEPETDDLQPELVETAEHAQVRSHEGSNRHVAQRASPPQI